MKRSTKTISTILILSLTSIISSGSGSEIPTFNSVAVLKPPSFTQNYTKMAYMEQGEEFTIRLYDWETHEIQEISYLRPVFEPRICGDGKKLLYLKLLEDGNHSELWRRDLETGGDRRLTDETYGDVYSYAVSPNNLHVVFVTFEDGRNIDGREYQELLLLSLHDMMIRSIARFDFLDIAIETSEKS